MRDWWDGVLKSWLQKIGIFERVLKVVNGTWSTPAPTFLFVFSLPKCQDFSVGFSEFRSISSYTCYFSIYLTIASILKKYLKYYYYYYYLNVISICYILIIKTTIRACGLFFLRHSRLLIQQFTGGDFSMSTNLTKHRDLYPSSSKFSCLCILS
jgi:hypothetical protein